MTGAASFTATARTLLGVAVCTTGLLVSVDARQVPSRPQQTFRTGVDVIQLDVSVLDKDRRPVRGLTASDFTVTEDGQTRPVVAFKAIDLPAPAPAPADQRVSEDRVPIEPASFGTKRMADYRFPIPTARLSHGECVLKIDAEAGGRSGSRSIRFRIE
jgi:hypothetical protein